MFRHPAWAVGRCSSGPPAATTAGTKSTGGFLSILMGRPLYSTTQNVTLSLSVASHQHSEPERVGEPGPERDLPGEVGRPQRHPNPLAALRDQGSDSIYIQLYCICPLTCP